MIIWYEDGASRAVGNIRACLALAPVISRMKAVCLLLTFAADVVVVLLSRLATPVHSFNRVDQLGVIEGKEWGSGVGCSGVGQAKGCGEGGDGERGISTICENLTVLCMLFWVHCRPFPRIQHSRERYGV